MRTGATLSILVGWAVLAAGWPASTQAQQTTQPETLIPPVTDAARAAAFPDVDVSAVHATTVNYFVLFDQLEWQGDVNGGGMNWDSKGHCQVEVIHPNLMPKMPWSRLESTAISCGSISQVFVNLTIPAAGT